MPALEKISYFQNQRNEIPNQKLARELAADRDRKGIREIADNLWHTNQNVRSDCLKVLYEIGYVDPSLIAAYTGKFLNLLNDKENRMVWGAMIALALVSPLCPQEVWKNVDGVIDALNGGTVITVVWGIKTLTSLASANPRYRKKLLPVLFHTLQTCIPRDIPTHAGSIAHAINLGSQKDFLAVLEKRSGELTSSQTSRLKRVLKKLEVGLNTAKGKPSKSTRKRVNKQPSRVGRPKATRATAKRRPR